MRLESLRVEGFRCFKDLSIAPDPRLNLIHGPNAAGKTTLLEAIYLLGRGRSFRAAANRALIRHGADAFRIVAEMAGGSGATTIGIEGKPGSTLARVDGSIARKRSILAETFPVEVLEADVHQLVTGSPAKRRRFLDRGMFHVKHSFLDHWRCYLRAVRQRNAALRQEMPENVVRGWDAELLSAGEAITADRDTHTAALQAVIDTLAPELGLGALTVEYRPGWAGESLARALDRGWENDVRLRATQSGPHRAELAIRIAGSHTRGRLSRGEEKLVGAALLLGQTRLIADLTGRPGVFLVDDPVADLDRESLRRLLGVIEGFGIQIFLTVLDPGAVDLSAKGRMFHVEQGDIAAVV